jgi:hypothetical protein
MFTHILHTHYSAIKGFDWEDGAWHAVPFHVSRIAAAVQCLLRV